MKKFTFTIFFIFLCNISGIVLAVGWPVNPTTSQHSTTGTVGEFRGDATGQRFHRGVDITDNELGVYAITAGTTGSGGTTFWTRFVSVSGVLYFHVDPDVPNGTVVNIGDRIGTMRTDGPIHVHLQQTGANFLDVQLAPFIDNTDPTIHQHFFKREGHNYSTNRPDIDANDLWGRIDIVIRASDTRLNDVGNNDGGAVAPFLVKYELRSSDNVITIDNVNHIEFASYPTDNAAALHTFGFGSNTTNFSWVATNHPFVTPYNRYWNSFGRNGVIENWSGLADLDARDIQDARYKDARYRVRFEASDTQLSVVTNTAQQEHIVVLNNFRPYVKKVEIGAEPKYVGEWAFNTTDGSLKYLKTKDEFFSPGVHTVTIEFSEPVRDTPTLSISTFADAITLSSTQPDFEKTIWSGLLTIAAGDNSHDGIQTLTITANDLSGTTGEFLDGDPGSIALRDNNGIFQDADNGGNMDALHKIKIDTQAPVVTINVKTTL